MIRRYADKVTGKSKGKNVPMKARSCLVPFAIALLILPRSTDTAMSGKLRRFGYCSERAAGPEGPSGSGIVFPAAISCSGWRI